MYLVYLIYVLYVGVIFLGLFLVYKIIDRWVKASLLAKRERTEVLREQNATLERIAQTLLQKNS